MSKHKPAIDNAMSKQQPLFDTGLSEGSLDICLGLKQTISRQLHGMDRWIVAAQISRATCKEITKDMLDKVLSSDPSYQPSMLFGVGVTAITQDFSAFRYCLEPLGSDVLDPADRDLIELARIQEKMKVLEAEKMRILSKRGLK
jgi:hypothetical protein